MISAKPLPFPKYVPPKLWKKPKQRPLGRAKSVTLAAGFSCNDGVVICADTEMSIPGFVKYPESKIRVYSKLKTKPVFTFAGDTNFCGMYMHRIAKTIRDNESKKLGQLEQAILDEARAIHTEYSTDDYEQCSTLIMSLWWPSIKRRYLYELSRGVANCIKGVSCCGTGVAVTTGMMRELFSAHLSTQEVTLLAIYFLAEAKAYGDGVGKDSEVIVLHNSGSIEYFREHPCSLEIKEIEEDYLILKRHLKPILAALSNVSITPEAFADKLRDFSMLISAHKNKRQATYESLEKWWYRLDDDDGYEIEEDDITL